MKLHWWIFKAYRPIHHFADPFTVNVKPSSFSACFPILCMLSDSLCKEHGAGKQHMGSAHCRNNSLFLPVFPRAHRPCGYCDSFQSLSRLTYDLFQGAAVPLASRTIATTKTFFTFLADWKLQQSQGSGFDDFSFGISFLQKFVFYRDPPARSNEEPIASPLLR